MPENKENVSGKSRVWKRAGAVAAAGMLFGFGAATWFEASNPSIQKEQRWFQAENSTSRQTDPMVSAESMPLKQPTIGAANVGNTDSAEVERLKTRNRRLEAFVQVLQKRAQVEKRSNGLMTKN